MSASVAKVCRMLTFVLSQQSVTTAQLQRNFRVVPRTAQRWVRGLDDALGDNFVTEPGPNPPGKKFSIKRTAKIRDLLNRPATAKDVIALDVAIQRLEANKMFDAVETLRTLRRRLHDSLENPDRSDTDIEAMSAGWRFGFRPGPRVTIEREVGATLSDAILEMKEVEFTYRRGEDAKPEPRRLQPWGLLYGGRPQVVGIDPEAGDGGEERQFRLDRMTDVAKTDRGFNVEDDAFANYTASMFGTWKEKPVKVVLRFRPGLPDVKDWEFHPSQTTTNGRDGSLKVTFTAGGIEDMARFIMNWGSDVEILQPKALRKAVLRLRLDGLAPLIEELAGDAKLAGRIAALAESYRKTNRKS